MTAELTPLPPSSSGVSEADLKAQAGVPALGLPHMGPANLTDTTGLHTALPEELTAQPAASEQTEHPDAASQPAAPEHTDTSPTLPGSDQPVTGEDEADTMPEPQEAVKAPVESEAAPQTQLNLSHPSSELLATPWAPEADNDPSLSQTLPADEGSLEEELRYLPAIWWSDAARLFVQGLPAQRRCTWLGSRPEWIM